MRRQLARLLTVLQQLGHGEVVRLLQSVQLVDHRLALDDAEVVRDDLSRHVALAPLNIVCRPRTHAKNESVLVARIYMHHRLLT